MSILLRYSKLLKSIIFRRVPFDRLLRDRSYCVMAGAPVIFCHEWPLIFRTNFLIDYISHVVIILVQKIF